MIKHKPIPKCDVRIGNDVYKCNGQGIVELPEIYKQFNPIEEVKIKKKKVVKDEE
jgi:hypothetical protein